MSTAAPSRSHLADLVVITGFSGAGKSTAMAVFEDAGYFCVDNLPPEMMASLAELFTHEGSSVERAAIVTDVRGGEYFEGLLAVLDDLDARGVAHRVIFLECDEQTLLNRYQETRRRHPLAPEGTVEEGIAGERAMLDPVRERADLVMDTSGLTTAMLRRKLADELLPAEVPTRLAVTFTSFGHKHGPPRDADLAFDVRYLPNPHYEERLRLKTGLDPEVVGYIDRDGGLQELYGHLIPFLDYLLPQFLREGKAHLLVSIGCTGGRHRSVAIAEHLLRHYEPHPEYVVTVAHRDINKPPREAAP
ncbi:MAG TPA: RNase adapter RapZ [Solirubrobacteraceae bacterium]|nr:RNase adapter RapZ [Solirubrobacteraceae bacterium]